MQAGAAGKPVDMTAGKLVQDRAKRRRTRFRLAPDERVGDGVRRIARGQLELATGHLGGDDPAEAVHEARKSLKRVRAVVRLARDHLGDEVYRYENRVFRYTGRSLGVARDAEVLRQTLDALLRGDREELGDHAFAGARAAFDRDARSARERMAGAIAAIDAVRGSLGATRDRVGTWPLPDDADPGALAPGFERIYRRGRRALKAARRDRGDDQLHELRKRAKDLWHAAQILRPASPKRMKRLARRAHRLSDLLGNDHDLAVLLEAAGERHGTLRPGELALLTRLVERRRKRLQRKALARAKRLYRRKPKAWRKRLARGAAALS
jgi:CHAD domain-containing protein